MGFYFRKSVSFGPFRLNASKSGLGMSVGIPGFRVGSGPRGNYVQVGMGGVYYRQTTSARPASPSPQPLQQSTVAMRDIESVSATEIVDSSSEDLLNEIREKRRKWSLKPAAWAFGFVMVFFAMSANWPSWATGVVGAIGLLLVIAAMIRDRAAKTVVVHYELDPTVERAFRHFSDGVQAVARCQRTWYLTAEASVRDTKYHGGANSVVARHPTVMRNAAPPFFKTNVPVFSVGTGKQTLYFLPDRLLIYDNVGVGAVSYRMVDVTVARQRFLESGGVPSDATVVDHTWQYVNKSGGPDRRFSVNPRIPICLYDEVRLRTSSGLHEVLQLSRSGAGDELVAAVKQLAHVTR